MDNAYSQLAQADRARDLGTPEPQLSRDLEEIKRIAREGDDIVVLTPKTPQDAEVLRELLETLHEIDRAKRWLVLPYSVRIEHLSDPALKRLGLQRIPGHLGQLPTALGV